MNKIIKLFLASTIVVFASCSSDDELLSSDEAVKMDVENVTLESNSTQVNDDILPLEGKRDSLKKPPELKSLTYTDRYEIDQLNLVPVYLKVKGNSSNRHFITSSSKGAELTMETYRGNATQQFHIKTLPASTGIPYLIYSENTNTPISLGAYSSNPDVKVLYARNDANGSLFGSSWDFNKGEYSTDSFVIENQDFPESDGGSVWDIYYNVITVNDGKILFSKYNESPRQEFEIIPAETFVIEKIEFDVDAGAILSKAPLQIYKEGYSNTGPLEQTYTFEVNKSYTKTSSFNRKTSYNVSASATIKAKVPFIAEGEITTSITSGQEFTYGTSESKTIAVKRSYPVKVPANYRADLSVVFFKYQMDVDYIATCRGLISGRRVEIKGVWNGADVEETDADLVLTPLDGGTQRTIKITKEMLDSKKPIELE
jgi:hypothetical protein